MEVLTTDKKLVAFRRRARGSREPASEGPIALQIRIQVYSTYQHIQVAVRSTSLDMTAVFHARLHYRFLEIKIKHRKKKLYRTNQGSNFFGCSFSNGNNLKVPIPIPI